MTRLLVAFLKPVPTWTCERESLPAIDLRGLANQRRTDRSARNANAAVLTASSKSSGILNWSVTIATPTRPQLAGTPAK